MCHASDVSCGIGLQTKGSISKGLHTCVVSCAHRLDNIIIAPRHAPSTKTCEIWSSRTTRIGVACAYRLFDVYNGLPSSAVVFFQMANPLSGVECANVPCPTYNINQRQHISSVACSHQVREVSHWHAALTRPAHMEVECAYLQRDVYQ